MSAIAPPKPKAAAAENDASSASIVVAAAARLDAAARSLPAPGPPFLDASVSPDFRKDAQEVRERAVKLLKRLQKTSAAAQPLLGDDPRAARDAVARVLDPLVERLSKEKKEASESSAAEAAEEAPPPHAPSWGRNGGPSSPAPLSPSPSSGSRPQDSFDPRVDNDRRAAFVPPREGWRACCRIADGGEGVAAFADDGDDDDGDDREPEGGAANASAPPAPPASPQCTYHPLERLLASLDTCTQPWQLERGRDPNETPPPPPPLSATPFTFVDTPSALSSLVERWLASGIRELAFDLEAHSFHSFQGFTCLIQLSTRAEDAVVDAIALRSCAGPLLAPLFADPRVAKVAHGARHDVSWLQRDFGLFVCNLFDTGVAAGLAGRPRGLGALYEGMLGLRADKRWQTADWRLRPLPRAALAYAREDTHWLLHVADRLKQELFVKSDGAGGACLLRSALEASRQLCLSRYEPERFSRRRALAVAATVGGMRAPGAAREVFVSLADWRDSKARLLDESTGAVLPKGLMAKISKSAADRSSSPLSFDAAALRSAAGGSPCMVSKYSREVVDAVREGLRRWERLRSGEASESSLARGEGGEDEEEDGGGGRRDGGEEEGGGGGKDSLLSRPAASAAAPKPMLLDPSSNAANNAVPFNRRGGGGGNGDGSNLAAVVLPASGGTLMAAALGSGIGKVRPSLSASAAAFSPSPMAAASSSFFGNGSAHVQKQRQQPPPPPPQLSFSVPLAFAPAKAPSPPPPPPAAAPAPAAVAAVAAPAAPAPASENPEARPSTKGDDAFLPVPLGDLRPGALRAKKGQNRQQQQEEEEGEDKKKKKKKKKNDNGGAFGDGDTAADAAVASILKAGRRAMEVSSDSSFSSGSGSGSSDSESDSESDSDSDSAPEEAAAAVVAARSRLQQQQQPLRGNAPAAAAAPRPSKKRPSPASFDFEAKIAASPGIVSAAEPPPPADGGRGRGGRGGGASASARGGGRGRGRLGSNRDLLPAGPAPPTASFDPYALTRLGEIKGGKRSGTMPKSGNKSRSFL